MSLDVTQPNVLMEVHSYSVIEQTEAVDNSSPWMEDDPDRFISVWGDTVVLFELLQFVAML